MDQAREHLTGGAWEAAWSSRAWRRSERQRCTSRRGAPGEEREALGEGAVARACGRWGWRRREATGAAATSTCAGGHEPEVRSVVVFTHYGPSLIA
jgi:hypothetical protein